MPILCAVTTMAWYIPCLLRPRCICGFHATRIPDRILSFCRSQCAGGNACRGTGRRCGSSRCRQPHPVYLRIIICSFSSMVVSSGSHYWICQTPCKRVTPWGAPAARLGHERHGGAGSEEMTRCVILRPAGPRDLLFAQVAELVDAHV